jgi:hypothetical protein
LCRIVQRYAAFFLLKQRYILALLLLAAILLAVAMPLYWRWMIHELKATAHQRHIDRELTKLQLERSEYEAARVDRQEIRWQGAMYDVERAQIVGDSVYVYAHRDYEEEYAHQQSENSNAPQITKVLGDMESPPSTLSWPIIFAPSYWTARVFSPVSAYTSLNTSPLERPPV